MTDFPSAFDDSDEPGAPEETEVSKYLHKMDDSELLKLRAEIDDRLSATTLQHLNLEQELVINYLATRSLMNRTINTQRIPENQKASVITTCRGLLESLIRLQTEVYNSEQLKQMEYALVCAIKTLDLEVQNDFFEIYGEKYAGVRKAYEQKAKREGGQV